MSTSNFCRRTRREFLWEAGAGFTGLALTGLLVARRLLRPGAGAARPRQSARRAAAALRPARPRASSSSSCTAGPARSIPSTTSRTCIALDGQTIPVRTFGRGGHRNQGRVVGPKWKFKQYGQCGKYISDLFPHLGTCADDIAFLHSMTADSPIHGSAMLQMNTGKILSGSPCLGSWVNYGLGTVNQNLPGFCVMLDPTGGPISGAKNWTSGYMPASYQGTIFRSAGPPILDLQRPARRHRADAAPHARHAERLQPRARSPAQPTTATCRPASPATNSPTACRSSAAEAVDLDQETEETKRLYGYDNPTTQDFARKCILARRLVERGVRFIQIYSGGTHNDDNWDAHGDLVAQPQPPRRPHRQADRRPDQGPETPRPAR